jgi:glycosyltransferase involved in cell wall biosynthesis
MFYRGLSELMRSSTWDVVHVWQEPFTLPGWQAIHEAPASSVAVFATFQNIAKGYVPPFNWMERATIRKSTGWIAFGQTVHSALRERPGYSERPSVVIPVGVDTERFRCDPAAKASIRSALGWSDKGPPVIGYLGRFVPEKGLSVLIRVLNKLDEPWRALFIGSGPLESHLRQFACQYPERVRVATGVTHDQVPAYLNAMDVLAAPSQTSVKWKEQLGRMLLEAFACNIAVIGSDSGEIPYVIGDAGRVVNESDESQWVSNLNELLGNPKTRNDLAARGRARVEQHFAWPVVANAHLNFFENLR